MFLNLYIDLKKLRLPGINIQYYAQICEEVISNWELWVEAAQPPEIKNFSFKNRWYIEMKDEMGW